MKPVDLDEFSSSFVGSDFPLLRYLHLTLVNRGHMTIIYGGDASVFQL